MANYTQSTNFATKDALPSGDPLKIVKGTEINTEFNNISVAIATKADLVSPTFTGNVTVSGTTALQATSATNFSYTGTLTGSTSILNIGSGQFYKSSTGNIGIQTTTPEANLDINGSQVNRGDVTGYMFFAPKYGTTPFGANYDRFEIRVDPNVGGATEIGNVNGGTGVARSLSFITGALERMRIDGITGDVAIGGAITSGAVPVVTTTGTQTLTNKTTTTQSFGTNNTTIASTEFVQAALAAVFPVGSIYTATVSTNPGTLLGFGSWTAFGAGRVLIGNGGGYTAGATGGSADAVVVSHTHTATSTVTDPTHSHVGGYVSGGQNTGSASPPAVGSVGSSTSTASTGITVATTNTSTGSSGTNANLQPYIVVYMWTRTA